MNSARTLAAGARAHKGAAVLEARTGRAPTRPGRASNSRLRLTLGRRRTLPTRRRGSPRGRQRILGRGVLSFLLDGTQFADVLLVLIIAVRKAMAAGAVGHEVELLS